MGGTFELQRQIADAGAGMTRVRFSARNPRDEAADVFVYGPSNPAPEWLFVPEQSIKHIELVVPRDRVSQVEAHVRLSKQDQATLWTGNPP